VADQPNSNSNQNTDVNQPSGITGNVRVKIDGVWHDLTPQEAYQWISKAKGADQSFRETAESRKAFEAQTPRVQRLEKWEGLLAQVKAGGMDSIPAFKELMTEFGLSELADQALSATGEEQSDAGPAAALAPEHLAALRRANQFFSACERAGVNPDTAIPDLRDFKRNQVTGLTQQYVRDQLLKHPVLGRALKGPKGSDVFQDIWSRFQRRVAGREPPTNETIQNAANEVVAILDAVVPARSAPSEGVYPGMMGAVPSSGDLGSSMLHPPKDPDPKLAQTDLSEYINQRFEVERWKAQNSEPGPGS